MSIRTKQTYSLFPSNPVTVFFTAEKLRSLSLWNFQSFNCVYVVFMSSTYFRVNLHSMVYQLSSFGFKSRCCHLNFSLSVCFYQLFCENISVFAYMDWIFSIANLLEVSRKNHFFFSFIVFNPKTKFKIHTKTKLSVPIKNVKTKVVLWKGCWNT